MTQLGKDTSVLGLAADHRAVAKLLSPSVQGSPGACRFLKMLRVAAGTAGWSVTSQGRWSSDFVPICSGYW